MKKFFFLIIIALFLTACSPAENDETTSDVTPGENTEAAVLYSDYYTDVEAVVTEYNDFSIDITSDSRADSEYKNDICYSGGYVCFYDLIPTVVDSNTQNGIIRLDSQGNRTRICPEPDCTADDVCGHIVLRHECIISLENYIFVSGVPALGDGFYGGTCIMRYDLTTGEYRKYAEIPEDDVELFAHDRYLFAQVQVGENNALLYCYDLSNDCGCKLVFTSSDVGPAFVGVCGGYVVAKDQGNVYFIGGNGEVVRTFATEENVGFMDIYENSLYYEVGHRMYRYDFAADSSELLIDGCNGFDIYDGKVYFFRHEEAAGLEYLELYEDEGGGIAYRTADYPLNYGTAIYSFDLISGTYETCITVANGAYLSGEIHVSEFGFVYGYYTQTDKPQKSFPSTTVLRDLVTGDEVTITSCWNGRGRSYGE